MQIYYISIYESSILWTPTNIPIKINLFLYFIIFKYFLTLFCYYFEIHELTCSLLWHLWPSADIGFGSWMSEKANIGWRVKLGILMSFINIPYICLTVPKISSIGYSRNKRIFPLTLQNYSLTTLFLQFLTGKDHLPSPTSTCTCIIYYFMCHFWSTICQFLC